LSTDDNQVKNSRFFFFLECMIYFSCFQLRSGPVQRSWQIFLQREYLCWRR